LACQFSVGIVLICEAMLWSEGFMLKLPKPIQPGDSPHRVDEILDRTDSLQNQDLLWLEAERVVLQSSPFPFHSLLKALELWSQSLSLLSDVRGTDTTAKSQAFSSFGSPRFREYQQWASGYCGILNHR
jgi:hypothetical protein